MAATLSSTAILSSLITIGADLVWTSVLDSLESEVGARELRTLVENSRFLPRDGSQLPAAVHVDVLAPWQRDGRLQTLCSAVGHTSEGLRLAVTPVCDEELDAVRRPRPRADFVLHDANRSAYQQVAACEPGVSLLVGPEGSGKTHMLLQLAEQAGAAQRALFVPADHLTLGLVQGVQDQRLESVRESLRGAELLLVDGLERLAGRAGSQNELGAALQHHQQAGGRVLLASRELPSELGRLRPALRRGLEEARSYLLRPPAPGARAEILRQRIARWPVSASSDAAEWLSRQLRGSLAGADALLTRVLAHPTCRDGLIDLERHQREIDARPGERAAGVVPPTRVLEQVCRHFNLRLADLLGAGRGPRVTRPRQLAMYLLRHRSRLSYPEIGQRLRRHHTTALHACRRVAERRDEDASLAAAIELIEKELDPRFEAPAERRG